MGFVKKKNHIVHYISTMLGFAMNFFDDLIWDEKNESHSFWKLF